MSENPLDPSPETERRVAALARELWDADGKPVGREAEYRERADELIRMENAAGAAQLPNPMTQNELVPGVVVEEASIQKNLGEFPAGRMTDQGDWRETPMTREELRDGDPDAPNRGNAP